MASEELPIEASAIEAAAKAIWGNEVVEALRDNPYLLAVAEAAIRAYQEAMGMTVERRTVHPAPWIDKEYYRVASRWYESKKP